MFCVVVGVVLSGGDVRVSGVKCGELPCFCNVDRFVLDIVLLDGFCWELLRLCEVCSFG